MGSKEPDTASMMLELEKEPRIVKVVNVKGHPESVEKEVNDYLRMGYDINSALMEWTVPGTHQKIFVQQVVLYDDEALGGDFELKGYSS